MNRLLYALPLAALLALAGCGAGPSAQEAVSPAEPAEIAVLPAEPGTPIPLELSAAEAGAGYERAGSVVTVRSPGTYRVTGSLSGQLAVDADGPVELILAGVSLEGPEALCVRSKDAVRLTAELGTVNAISDGLSAPDENATAALWSKAPLTIGGQGTVTVTAAGNNGVQCKSLLTVEGAALTVRAQNNALKGEGGVTVSGGALDLTAGGDGIKAEAGRLAGGDIAVTGGSLSIRAAGRGLRAEGSALLSGGTVYIESTDDAVKGVTVTVSGGSVNAFSLADGLQAEDTLTVSGGELTVGAAEDALRAVTANVAEGTLLLTAGGDGIQADTLLTVSGGSIGITAGEGGGGAINKSGDDFGPWSRSTATTEEEASSAKGLKCDGEIRITGGAIGLSTQDDAVHAGTLLSIEDGALTIYAGDDALHADDMMVINGGRVDITDCFEGLEAFAIEVNGGDITIRAVNDGINANGSEFGMFGGPWGRGSSEVQEVEITSLSGSADTYYRQTGGTVDLVVTGTWNNVGDGIDSNGYVLIDGGVLTVSTFGNTQEGGIDTGRDGPVVTGGMVMAGGAGMMQESWAAESTQCCAVINVDLQPGGTPVTIYDESGNAIWSVTLANTFNCIVLSHPDLQPGHIYTVDYGGGTQTLDFTSSTILRVGSSGWGFGRFR